MKTSAKKKLVSAGLVAAAIVAFSPGAKAVGGVTLEVGQFALESGVFNAVFAKELCSCMFVDEQSYETCQANDNLPGIAHKLVDVEVDQDTKTITSSYKAGSVIAAVTGVVTFGQVKLGGPATARFDAAHPEYGCVMTKTPLER